MATPEELLKQANELYYKNQYQAVIDLLTNEVLEQHKDARLYNSRGMAFDDWNDYDQAIADYNKAIEIDPEFSSAYYNRGNLWYNKGDYDKAIADYSKAIEIKPNHVNAYNNRGNSWNNKGIYDKAIIDHSQVIKLNPSYVSAYYNRANEWREKGEYDKAIADYTRAIELRPEFCDAYNNRGIAWKNKGHPDEAIADYGKAIELNPNIPDPYYNRGLERRASGKNLDACIKDFEKYLDLTNEKDDLWAKRAKDFIEEIREKIKDKEIAAIGDLTSKIKKLLLITEGCITHYTGLSVLRKLILEGNSLFRISEGSFLNDTSEGTELFNYLQYQSFNCKPDGLIAAPFAPKPFIGSFVAETKHDDLNLWRFYGKENGVEARGCAITLKMKDFIEEINLLLTKGQKENNRKIEDDINFYRVAYWDHDITKPNFHIPGAEKAIEDGLNTLMQELKEKVTEYKGEDRSVLEKYLNSIAFLFKSDAYKNENEIRLVIKGVEFEKKCDRETNPPKVYIELVNIRKLVKQITLGPKVSKPDEWASAIYYSYDTEPENRPEKILISRLPYK
ncbi:tetratricopeptide repeat protein [Paludibacter sp.]|uniref:tetratricopeptide repeat protein n=1 Tax=Paludibacter sp. TaxID=1898105 RepID=UPI0025CF5FEE|nr:tetratricopeptide repeat protein [Paludibacter sp.]